MPEFKCVAFQSFDSDIQLTQQGTLSTSLAANWHWAPRDCYSMTFPFCAEGQSNTAKVLSQY